MTDYHVAVDIGGTFTDVVVQRAGGGLWTTKTPSTPADLADGFMAGVRHGLAQANADAPVDASNVLRLFHGTTIATNAVIERRPATVGLLTTRGFKYVLEIGRHDIPRGNNIYGWVKPERPVPPARIFEITERLDRNGETIAPRRVTGPSGLVQTTSRGVKPATCSNEPASSWSLGSVLLVSHPIDPGCGEFRCPTRMMAAASGYGSGRSSRP